MTDRAPFRLTLARPALAFALCAAGLAAAPLHAQTTAPAATPAPAAAPVSPAKRELVQRVIKLQQPAIESLATQLANQTAAQMMQGAGQQLARVPQDKRQAVAAEVQGDVKKFFDETSAMLRATATRVAPGTLAPVLEQGFSEDELKQLVAWLESPVSRKYQQVGGDLQKALGEKLIAESRTQVEGKIKELEQRAMGRINAAAGTPAAPKDAAPAAKK